MLNFNKAKLYETCKLIKRHRIIVGLVPSEANEADPPQKDVKVNVKFAL